MRPASQRFFIHSCIYLRILIISYLATFLGTNSLSVLMCRKAINQTTKVVGAIGLHKYSVSLLLKETFRKLLGARLLVKYIKILHIVD